MKMNNLLLFFSSILVGFNEISRVQTEGMWLLLFVWYLYSKEGTGMIISIMPI